MRTHRLIWLVVAVIIGLNLLVCRRLFAIEYLRWLESIEGVYPALASWILSHWPDLGWMPAWYCGIPFQNAYPPVLPFSTAALAALFRISPGHSYHSLCGAIYCAGPLSLLALVRRFSGSWKAAISAAVVYSLISPSALLVPAIAHDLGGALNDRRMHVLAFYGEAPHLLALAMAPVAVLLLDRALGRRTPLSLLGAAAVMALTVLTNWLGAATLAILVVSVLFAQKLRGWLLVLAISGAAYVLAAPWIPPSTIRVIAFNSRTLGGYFPSRWWQIPYTLGIAAAVLLLHRLMRAAPPAWRMSACWLLITALILLPAMWSPFYVVPQPSRYQLPFDVAASFAAGLAIASIPLRAAAALLAALCVFQVPRHVKFAARFLQPIDIRTTAAYKTAQWCEREMRGRRIMVPGSTTYYLNIFTDTPQLAGGFEQGDPSWVERVAMWTIYTGANAGDRDVEISLLWLKAYRARAVETGGPASGEPYRPFLKPYKFDGVLPLLWSDGDDRIYRVPAVCDSLASAVRREEIVSRRPVDGLDVDELRAFVAGLDRGRCGSAELTATGRLRVRAQVQAGEVVSLGVTHHPGWRGPGVRLSRDALGLMVIDPGKPGPLDVEMVYDGGAEMRIAVLAQRALLALFLLAAAVFPRQR